MTDGARDRVASSPIFDPVQWAGPGSKIGQHVERMSKQWLEAYRAQPGLVEEQTNFERTMAKGGYGHRQVFELVQNGADAMISSTLGRIEVVLTNQALYCANQGEPVSIDGVKAILGAYVSDKRSGEIGRFGLGFKSVLGVTDRPEFFSKSGSFGFDSDKSAKEIWSAIPALSGNDTPTLRLAFPLDPQNSAESDPLLAKLMGWADTVVKLPRVQEETPWLEYDIEQFPAEFLLFCPHIGEIVLRDVQNSVKRILKVKSDKCSVMLDNGDGEERWKIFGVTYRPSEGAREDAGEINNRQELPIVWAVPMDGRTTPGKFWAFSPTEYETTLSGILNAPWKLSEDRKTLIDGYFNQELMERASKLVVVQLENLTDEDDPGRVLDIMPARGREARNWADSKISESVYKYAAAVKCIPDQKGIFQLPRDLKLHPSELPESALNLWFSYSNRPVDWCHPSVESVDRRSRIERLMALNYQGGESITEWLEALVVDLSIDASAAAICAASEITDENGTPRLPAKKAQIVLNQDGQLVPAQTGTLFVPPANGVLEGEFNLVNQELLQIDGVRDALNRLGIMELDASSELQAFLVGHRGGNFEISDWDRFWCLSRRVETSRAYELIKTYMPRQLEARNIEGQYRLLSGLLLPGPIVPADGSRDAEIAVDTVFHLENMDLLHRLGAVSGPTAGHNVTDEPWFPSYKQDAVENFLLRPVMNGRTPRNSHLKFEPGLKVGPLSPIRGLSEIGSALFTSAILSAEDPTEVPWIMKHDSPGVYQPMEFPPPAKWILEEYGKIETSLGIRSINEAVGPTLGAWGEILPVAVLESGMAERLELPGSLGDLAAEHLDEAMNALDNIVDDGLIARFYASLCVIDDQAPERLRCRIGQNFTSIAPESVTVTWEPALFESLRLNESPALLVPNQTAGNHLLARWGLKSHDESLAPTVDAEESGEEIQLVDQFPALRSHIDDATNAIRLVPCSALRLEVLSDQGKRGQEKEFLRFGSTIYFRDSLSQPELLDLIVETLGLGITDEERAVALDYRQLLERREKIANIRRLTSLPEKLVEALGADTIRRRLPAGLAMVAQQRLGREPNEAELAEFAIAVYGVETLHEFRSDLVGSGLEPPANWAGGKSARAFVRMLGFPAEFAGFEQPRRVSWLDLQGPPQLPSLHEFQERSVDKIRGLFESSGNQRGLLSLPTGAGKTRICVEAITRSAAENGLTGPILWIAQTDELCEQAVQAWSEVWRSFGPQGRMRISRLWGANDATPFLEGNHIVVATIDKIQGCIGAAEYDWLDEASCLIIDEAHSATTPSYTNLLNWQGLGRGRARCPFIGLTATPFRGGTEETERLVRRFQSIRLDDLSESVEEVYPELQRMGVLAKVEHAVLAGAEVTLSDEELKSVRELRTLPPSVTSRLGQDVARTEDLLDSIKGHPDDWSILVFATSVGHAQIMAGMLRAEGVSAAAITGQTDAAARRFYIEEFRAGRIRVLTNYAVLTAGFDAPQVRAVYVARPTYSRGLYQQMIGRGLRGPLNGGKPVCLIVNVKDNIINYDQQLAFTEYEYLWNSGLAESTE